MILDCPSCSAKFMISSEALGPDGRDVRCGKCGYMWFQENRRDSLDELSDFETKDVEDRPPVAEPARDVDRPALIDIPRSFAMSDDMDIGFDEAPPAVSYQAALPDPLRHVAAVMVALAVISVMLFCFAAARNSLGRLNPFFSSAYNAMSFSLEPEKAKVAFDRLKIAREGENISGEGYLINLTSENLSIAEIKIDLMDAGGKILKTTDIKLAESLKGESSYKFNFAFPASPPEAVSAKASLTH